MVSLKEVEPPPTMLRTPYAMSGTTGTASALVLRFRAMLLRRRHAVATPCPVSYTHLTLPTICSV
eukprot:3036625-Rhodomonas_salina.4